MPSSVYVESTPADAPIQKLYRLVQRITVANQTLADAAHLLCLDRTRLTGCQASRGLKAGGSGRYSNGNISAWKQRRGGRMLESERVIGSPKARAAGSSRRIDLSVQTG
jgi:hypothetical protein